MDKDKTSEIAKLTERISNDPKSKLFVPLAEEYKKAGDIEMSIHVLTEGLKNNPGYVTARSFLGRLLIEQGDLPGAQKEFEEVIKAIPDNLMAQRKLGDIYALQDRTADALRHYKIALSLNPKDGETAMLITESEAGRDVKKHLAKPKTIVSDDTQKKQEPALQKIAGQPAVKVQPQAVSTAAKRFDPVQKPMAATAEEEAEEVLVVEPLDAITSPAPQHTLEQELAAKNLDFLAEAGYDQGLPDAAAAQDDQIFSVDQPLPESSADIAEPAPLPKEHSAPVKAPDESDKRADDFTTDTLAELYISQGFYEKAVDIYERMLVDNPNSKGLKNKLAAVRAMAASAAPHDETEAGAASVAYPPVLDAEQEPAVTATSEFDAFVPPAREAGQPGPDGWDMPPESPVLDQEMPPQPEATRQPHHFDTGFEPREYGAPVTAPQPGIEKTRSRDGEHGAEQKRSGPRKLPASRKDTVDRLENWLKNIMKET